MIDSIDISGIPKVRRRLMFTHAKTNHNPSRDHLNSAPWHYFRRWHHFWRGEIRPMMNWTSPPPG